MRTRGFFLTAATVVALTLGMTSCDEELLNINIPMEFSEATFEVPITLFSGEYTDSTTCTSNLDSILTANKVKKENIKSITLEKLTLNCEDKNDTINNFRVLESVKGSLAKDGGAYVTVGEITNNPDVINYELDVPLTNQEYKDYLNGSNFTFKVSGKTRGPVTRPITVHARLKFNLEGGL